MSSDETKEPRDAGELLGWAIQTQRNIDFIIKQQAQFSIGMQQLREAQESAERRWTRTEESVRNLLAIAQSHEDEINALREAQERTDRQMAETGKRMAETDERLNALINFVELRAAEGRDGGQQS
jgi:chromosome segregation ATPase